MVKFLLQELNMHPHDFFYIQLSIFTPQDGDRLLLLPANFFSLVFLHFRFKEISYYYYCYWC